MLKELPLSEMDRARGARMMEYAGCSIPAEYYSLESEYAAIQEGVGLLDLSRRAKVRLTGRDRRTWLQGLVTQDVTNLPDGRSAPAAMLNPQGHLLGVMRISAAPGELLLDAPAELAGALPEYLDRYLFAEKVEIEDVTASLGILSLQGPHAPLVIAAVFGSQWAELPADGLTAVPWSEGSIVIARARHCGEEGFDLIVDAARAPALHATLYTQRPAFAVQSVGWNAFNLRRVEAGMPWWGHELDESVVPFEARLESHISLTKGCYVGQEIIARLHARGQVNNLLCGLLLEGSDPPEHGAEIRMGARKVGRITSAVRSLRLDRSIALGFLRREHSAAGSELRVRGAAGEFPAAVADLPFLPNDY